MKTCSFKKKDSTYQFDVVILVVSAHRLITGHPVIFIVVRRFIKYLRIALPIFIGLN